MSLETAVYIAIDLVSLIGSLLIMRSNWKRYGLLLAAAGAAAVLTCYLFVRMGFYCYPSRLFGQVSIMPLESLLIAIPFLVLLGVRYSPLRWLYKIPFYLGIVQLAMAAELLIHHNTNIIEYGFMWNFINSYFLWWTYLILFEWIGSKILPSASRYPLKEESFHYGNWAFIALHIILLFTIFLGGYYLGRITPHA